MSATQPGDALFPCRAHYRLLFILKFPAGRALHCTLGLHCSIFEESRGFAILPGGLGSIGMPQVVVVLVMVVLVMVVMVMMVGLVEVLATVICAITPFTQRTLAHPRRYRLRPTPHHRPRSNRPLTL